MKNQLFSIAGVMVWATFPLTGGIYYWEHTLQLTATGHKLIQVLLLPVVFGWAYFWNTQAEYYRLRHRLDDRTKQMKVQHHQVTVLSFDASPVSNEHVSSAKSQHVLTEETFNEMNLHEEYPFEAPYHVPNY